MKPDESITSTSIGLEKGTNCYYKTYNDPRNPDSFEVVFDESECGWN